MQPHRENSAERRFPGDTRARRTIIIIIIMAHSHNSFNLIILHEAILLFTRGNYSIFTCNNYCGTRWHGRRWFAAATLDPIRETSPQRTRQNLSCAELTWRHHSIIQIIHITYSIILVIDDVLKLKRISHNKRHCKYRLVLNDFHLNLRHCLNERNNT